MSRQPQNEALAETSFLHGVNAAYVEEMQAMYESNPGSVSDEWRLFFQSLNEGSRGSAAEANSHGPSWARPLDEIGPQGNQDLLGALTGDYGGAEKNFREKFEALNHVHRTDGEFQRLLDKLITPDVFTAARTLRERTVFTGVVPAQVIQEIVS